ncbi:olfactory receptor 14I1-like [Heliangelus exortis]|uniref:olfactory receptor 14I1-like n=1 Tax=Heliangelus exortis TaxID=472823 RepID=UPI003A8C9F0E
MIQGEMVSDLLHHPETLKSMGPDGTHTKPHLIASLPHFTTSQFLLLAFADRKELQLLHFWLFLGIYLAALLGNGLIITTIACDHHLHTPMYFLLFNLSLLDLAGTGGAGTIREPAAYTEIFRAVLRIPSEQGRHKAFSTCLPHLSVVSLFISTAIFAYLKPSSFLSPSLVLVLSFLYSVVPPAVNPLIYSMRNQELKSTVWKLVARLFS